jgi:hypothetical protein
MLGRLLMTNRLMARALLLRAALENGYQFATMN